MNSERTEARFAAPAKINFGLRVLGRRSDGYHELDSLFLPLDLADEIQLSATRESAASASGVDFTLRFADAQLHARGDVPSDRDNLAVRAARAFLGATGISHRLKISLTKGIPAAAGLGGGSSDAGAVLRALDEIFPKALSVRALEDLAIGLGADVPYFLDPRPARVTGIGEAIEACEVPSLTLLLANPGVPLSTAQVFRAWDANFEEGRQMGAEPSKELSSSSRPGAPAVDGRRAEASMPSVANDLESAATALCPSIAILREGLASAGALEIGMSGSGPTVFGVFENEDSAERASGILREVCRRPAEEPAEAQSMRLWARVATTLHSP